MCQTECEDKIRTQEIGPLGDNAKTDTEGRGGQTEETFEHKRHLYGSKRAIPRCAEKSRVQ